MVGPRQRPKEKTLRPNCMGGVSQTSKQNVLNNKLAWREFFLEKILEIFNCPGWAPGPPGKADLQR